MEERERERERVRERERKRERERERERFKRFKNIIYSGKTSVGNKNRSAEPEPFDLDL